MSCLCFLADSRLFRPSLPGPTLCLRELNYVWPLELICFIFTWNSIGLLFKPCACYCKNKVSDLNPGLICQISYVNQNFLDYGRVAGAYVEDITWPRGDTKFLFECWKRERVKYSQHEKRNFASPSDNVIFFLLYKIPAIQQKILYSLFEKLSLKFITKITVSCLFVSIVNKAELFQYKERIGEKARNKIYVVENVQTSRLLV